MKDVPSLNFQCPITINFKYNNNKKRKKTVFTKLTCSKWRFANRASVIKLNICCSELCSSEVWQMDDGCNLCVFPP